MASASSLAHFNAGDAADKGLETIEIDPQYAEGLGFALGDVVRLVHVHICFTFLLSIPPPLRKRIPR